MNWKHSHNIVVSSLNLDYIREQPVLKNNNFHTDKLKYYKICKMKDKNLII